MLIADRFIVDEVALRRLITSHDLAYRYRTKIRSLNGVIYLDRRHQHRASSLASRLVSVVSSKSAGI